MGIIHGFITKINRYKQNYQIFVIMDKCIYLVIAVGLSSAFHTQLGSIGNKTTHTQEILYPRIFLLLYNNIYFSNLSSFHNTILFLPCVNYTLHCNVFPW